MDRQTRQRWLAETRLYVCVGAHADLAGFAAAAARGGVGALQVRVKGLEAREELAQISLLASGVREHGALLSVNDRADLAVLADADILHVGQGDLPPSAARRLAGELLIGQSTHTREQAERAMADRDVDYFCVGPCWETPTKPGRPAAGLDLVRWVADQRPDKPWFAIGGIDLPRLPEVRAAGATRVVVVRAVTEAPDPEAAAARIVAALQ